MKLSIAEQILVCTLLVMSLPSYGEGTRHIYFKGVDQSIFATLETEKDGSKTLSVGGTRLKPQSQEYIDLIAEGYLSALLSPDKARLLVSLGDMDEKNVWVLNLKTSKLELTSHENVGRHLFPKWLDANSFELMYGGMGYQVAREYKLQNDSWDLVRDQTVEHE